MNYGELKGFVKDFLHRDDLDAKIPYFITAAQTRLERKTKPNGESWKCMEAWASQSVSTGSVSLLSTYKQMRWVKILDGGQYYTLTRYSPIQVFGFYPENYLKRPEIFTIIPATNELLLRPAPDKSYTLDMLSYHYTTALSGDADTNWWTVNNWELLLYGALTVASRYIPGDQRLMEWKEAYMALLADLIKEESAEDWSGSYMTVGESAQEQFTIDNC